MKLKSATLCLTTTLLASAGLSPAFAQEGKDVTVVLAETVDVVEPCMAARQDVGRVISENINEMLVEFDYVNGGLKPRLATEWTQLDADTWEFKLRPGVRWHDGTAFTARDVQFTVERNKNADLSCETGGKYFGGTEFSFEIPDDNTIRITTDPAQPILPLLLSTVPIVPSETTPDEFVTEPVGTGPYLFEVWNRGQDIVLKRNPDYWGEQPQVEEAIYLFRSDAAVAAAMVEAGEADIVPNLSMDQATNPETDFSYPNSETTTLRIDTTMAPTDDRRIREAMNLAIDREAFRGTLLPADVQPATQMVVPTTIGHNPDLAVWPYDPERAQALIEEARAEGVPVDAEIQIIGRTGIHPNATETMEAMMAMLRDVGLNVTLQMYEVGRWNEFLREALPGGPPGHADRADA